MKIIDAHVHTSFNREDLRETARKIGNIFTIEELNKQFAANGIKCALSITSDRSDATPLEYDSVVSLIKQNKRLFGVLGINPHKISDDCTQKIEEGIRLNLIKGLKIYSGYYHNYPYEEVYTQFYHLAGKHNIPVIFHCGDTYKKDALLKYAHPLSVDEVAVRFPTVNFVIAHFGNPWMLDAAEVVYKNSNVYTDLSGLGIGSTLSLITKNKLREALDYIDDYTKVLYGSDWPLVNIRSYIKTIMRIIPKQHRTKVFYDNAKRLFNL